MCLYVGISALDAILPPEVAAFFGDVHVQVSGKICSLWCSPSPPQAPASNRQHGKAQPAFYYHLLTSTGYSMNYFRGLPSWDEDAWSGEAFSGRAHRGLHDTPGLTMQCFTCWQFKGAWCHSFAIFLIFLCFYGKCHCSVVCAGPSVCGEGRWYIWWGCREACWSKHQSMVHCFEHTP